MHRILLVLGVVLLTNNHVYSRSAGPPLNLQVCGELRPGHGGAAQPGNGGYVITTDLPRISANSYSYTAGQIYTVTVNNTQPGQTFRGFLVIAHVPGQNNALIGQFTPGNANQQTLDCGSVLGVPNPTATIAHSNAARQNFVSQTMTWQAPADGDGTVDFRYTIVQIFSTYYVAQSAAQTSIQPIVTPPTPPVRAPEDYRLTFRTPSGCNLTNCTSFVGIDSNVANPAFLDIYMEGEALGWVAVGFTQTRNMFSADVVGCNRDPATNLVEVLDTYNVASPARNNLPDPTQDVMLFNSSFDGTRIFCTVVKSVSPSDPAPQDLNLNSSVYVLWGIRQNNSTQGMLPTHAPDIPAASVTPVNPSTGAVVSIPMRNPEDYRITFRQPPNCQLADCNLFVGIDTNTGDPSVLDITMQGVAGGWLAVGFTLTQNMFDADVVGCTRNPAGDIITAIDTWNDLVPTRNNIQDDTQDVVLLNSSFVNGTISCTFIKPIVSTDPTPQDRRLDSPHFIIYGYRTADNDPANGILSFPVHGVGADLPTSSPMMLNPAIDSNQPFAGVVAPIRDPEDYRLTFRTPMGCNVSNCTSFVGIDTNIGNNGVLDIYMEGEALGWVAVGFTETRNMFSADVVGCNRDPATNLVEVLDAYNVPSPGRNNLPDPIQDVMLFNSSFDGTRIICTVAKQIAPSDSAPQDLNLNSNLYVLWGIRPVDSTPGMLPAHAVGPGDIPAASEVLVNPAGVVLTTPVRAPQDYRLVFSNPANCDPSTCDIFVGIDTNLGNGGFLDIYMEGNAQGWVAVGFSDSQNMFSADVVGCNRDLASNMISAVDTWNSPSPARGNALDATQDVVLFQGSFANGRITCSVAKQIAPSDLDQDLSLDTDLYIMYGVGPTGSGAGSLLPHNFGPGSNPTLSQERFNAAADIGGGGIPFPTVDLLRAHGIIMLIAWPLLAISGIFFAAWMRPALPNGEWFKIHQGFLLGSMFVAAIGFALAFIANVPTGGRILLGSANPVGTAHFVIGIVIMLLHIVNPLIAACRCNPGDKKRVIFNVIHGSAIGLFVEVLALINISLGLTRFGPSSFFGDLTIFWVYIGYLIFFLVVTGVLFFMFTLLSFFSNDGERMKTIPSLIKPLISDSPKKGQKPVPTSEGVELAVPGQKPDLSGNTPPKPKMPSKDSPIRWGALTIFLTVNVVVMVILIILIAI